MAALPEDILHLIAVELSERNDFGTLFNCALTGQYFALPAIQCLYRIYHRSPVKEEASEIALAQQNLAFARWSILWRSILLSCFEKTLFPYYRYIRVLDLRDLENLIDDDQFRSQVSANFFDGPLEQFNITRAPNSRPKTRTLKRVLYDVAAIIDAVGEVISQKSSMLEELTVSTASLVRWVPRLAKLKSLDLRNGHPLGDDLLQSTMHGNCRELNSIRLFLWPSDDCDERLAMFLNGMPSQSLQFLETISDVRVGPGTFLALKNHSSSLTYLKLLLRTDTIQQLHLLRTCTALEGLHLTDAHATSNQRMFSDEEFKEITTWLCECTNLKSLTFTEFGYFVTAMVTPLLISNPGQLEELQVEWYPSAENRDFHSALTSQAKSLTNLSLRGESPRSRDDLDHLVECLSQMHKLQQLQLRDISDNFADRHVNQLAQNLLELEEVSVGGLGPTDVILNSLSQLPKLRNLTLTGISRFTTEGLVTFVENLGPGNSGMILNVDMADSSDPVSEQDQHMVRLMLDQKVGGRLEYTFWRDPDVSSYGSDSD